MDKNELLRQALNTNNPSDLNLNSPLNSISQEALSDKLNPIKLSSEQHLLNQSHKITKSTFIDSKGKNKQVLKNLKNARKY